MKQHMVPCNFGCGRQVDASNPHTHQLVTGYCTAGQSGGSDIVLRERLPKWACLACIEKKRAGIPIGQESLV